MKSMRGIRKSRLKSRKTSIFVKKRQSNFKRAQSNEKMYETSTNFQLFGMKEARGIRKSRLETQKTFILAKKTVIWFFLWFFNKHQQNDEKSPILTRNTPQICKKMPKNLKNRQKISPKRSNSLSTHCRSQALKPSPAAGPRLTYDPPFLRTLTLL